MVGHTYNKHLGAMIRRRMFGGWMGVCVLMCFPNTDNEMFKYMPHQTHVLGEGK